MATTVSYVGNQYSIPAYNDTGYAQGSGNLSSYLVALATGSLTLSGGSFPLTADVNFGSNFGLVALYLKSVSANIATAGVIRLANTDLVEWRNAANSGNNILAVNGSDQLTYNGNVIAAFGVPLPIADGGTNSTTALVNGFLMSSQAGAIKESAITISTAALGAISSITSSTANSAAAGFLRLANTGIIAWRNAAASADKTLTVNASDQLVYAGTVIFSSAGIAPVGAGGTNSGGALSNGRIMISTGGTIIEANGSNFSMNSGKITSLANGTAATDAAAFGQIFGGFQAPVMVNSTTNKTTSSSTFQDTALAATITPTSSSHRIRITMSAFFSVDNIATNLCSTIKRGSTNIGGSAGFAEVSAPAIGAGGLTCISYTYIDSPATGSATTYTMQIRSTDNTNNVEFAPGTTVTNSIILEEIV